jgi:hypothetical protein
VIYTNNYKMAYLLNFRSPAEGYKMDTFLDKYTLTKQQSLFLAKKKWDENIYCGMKMENRNITFPWTINKSFQALVPTNSP